MDKKCILSKCPPSCTAPIHRWRDGETITNKQTNMRTNKQESFKLRTSRNLGSITTFNDQVAQMLKLLGKGPTMYNKLTTRCLYLMEVCGNAGYRTLQKFNINYEISVSSFKKSLFYRTQKEWAGIPSDLESKPQTKQLENNKKILSDIFQLWAPNMQGNS